MSDHTQAGTNLRQIYVSAPSVVLPGRPVSNEELVQRIRENFRGSPEQWRRIERKIAFAFDLCGSQSRYLDDEAPAMSAAEYSAKAAGLSLALQGIAPAELDAVIYGAVCREYFEPATASEVAARVGATRLHAAFDIINACSGFLTAVTSFAGLAATDPDIRTGLICATEGTGGLGGKNRGWISYDIQQSSDLDLLAAGLTIGNAAAAAVVSTQPPRWGARVVGAASASYPQHYELSMARIDGVFECDSAGLFKHAKDYYPHIMGLLQKIGWQVDDVDYVCVHQASERIIANLAKQFGARQERIPLVHRYYGNTVSLSPILPLHHLLEQDLIKPGMKLIIGAAGAGITMNTLALEWCPDRRQ